MEDMHLFVMNAVPKGMMLQCTIIRKKKRFRTRYFLYLAENPVFLLAAKKRPFKQTSNYLITRDQQNLATTGPHFLGKVRSNFLGTQFTIFDHGTNPKSKESFANPENIREEHGIINYESNFFGTRGPRKMRVLLP